MKKSFIKILSIFSILFLSSFPFYSKSKVSKLDDSFRQLKNLEKDWYMKTNFYQIWIKSFNDSNGDGCGDIQGIIQKLDYIQKVLGADGVWISPFFDCYEKGISEDFNMHGYDTLDFYEVNDLFGTKEDISALIKECHFRGMKIIFDFIPNHVSNQSQWFLDSVNRRNGKNDWFIWSDKQEGHWLNPLPRSGWDWNMKRKQYYYHAFPSELPDLNYSNPEVSKAMKEVVRFWLNEGFDGIRLDAPRYLVEDEKSGADTGANHKWLSELRREVIDSFESPKFMMAEAWVSGERNTLDSYFGTKEAPEFNVVLDFDQGSPVMASINDQESMIISSMFRNPGDGKAYGTFLANHDIYNDRLGTAFGNDNALINQATVLSLMRPTIPVIYYGQEIAMSNKGVSEYLKVRGNFDWKAEKKQEKNLQASVLGLNSALLKIRKALPDLFAYGKIIPLIEDGKNYTAYIIKNENQKILCVYNLSSKSVKEISFELDSEEKLFKDSILLIGDSESVLSVKDNKLVAGNLSPFESRVYLLDYDGNQAFSNLFDNIIFREDYIHPVADFKNSMFWRGDKNEWGAFNMKKISEETSLSDEIWECIIDGCSKDDVTEFKFCVNSDSTWRTNWGLKDFIVYDSGKEIPLVKSGTDIMVKFLQNGKYRFVFNRTKLTCRAEIVE